MMNVIAYNTIEIQNKANDQKAEDSITANNGAHICRVPVVDYVQYCAWTTVHVHYISYLKSMIDAI